jgi:hypothetical protein
MEVWKKMYSVLCGAVSDTLDKQPDTAENLEARATLLKAMEDAEELYLSSGSAV